MDELGTGYNRLKVIILIMLVIMKEVECCFDDERIALLQLKSSFHSSSSPYRVSSSFYSWGITSDYNCCEWEGVECSNSSTGLITHLFVRGDFRVTEWKMNASLFFPFQQLTTLSLQFFFIGDSVHNQGFDRLSTLEKLESLDLSSNTFKDINKILSSIRRISSLKSLSLSLNWLNSTIDNIQGLVRLENLEVLDLSYNNFNNSIFSIVSGFSSLKSLSVRGTTLTDNKGFDMISRLEKLESLDLSNWSNNINQSILSSISNISSLKSLYLSNVNGLNSTNDIQGLSKLVNLEVLDLSYNNFNNNSLGLLSLASRLSSLKTLNLSDCGLKGTIDLQELDALSNLEVLKLSRNQITKVVASRDIGDEVLRNLSVLFLDSVTPENGSSSNVELHSLGAYRNLKTISLCGNNFEGPIFVQEEAKLSNLEELFFNSSFLDDKAFESLGRLPSLKRLSFAASASSAYKAILEGRPKNKLRFLRFFNLNFLEYVDMSYNFLDNSILKDIENTISLKTLRLSGCGLSSTLPTTLGLCNLRNLEELDLSSNELSGTLPWCITNLTSLQQFDLSGNHFIGSISNSPLTSLISLQELIFSNNQFQVPLSLQPFFNHSNLKYLNCENNHIIYEDDDVEVHDLTPKFQLKRLMLSSQGNGTRINGVGFPKFLWHQHDLQYVDLSNIQLKGEFPYWLLQNNTKLGFLNFANTSLLGTLHLPTYSHKYLQMLHISNNYLNDTIPIEIGQLLPNLYYLNLSGNSFSGGMPSSFGKMINNMLLILDLSYNELSGELPGNLEIGPGNNQLMMLDASNNHFSGSIPRWILNISSLQLLDLSGNNFSKILSTCTTTSLINFVYLSRNMLQGSVGTAFRNCSELVLLDLSHNNFSGTIPKWISYLSGLSYLLMNHNNLIGEIPIELCSLEKLSLLDLSNNNLSGHIHSCIRARRNDNSIGSLLASMEEPLELTTKSITYLFPRSIFELMAGIDLSCNNFSGEIPIEIGNQSTIQVLNFSHNSLIGPIPKSFSNLTQIESLDLSYNNLYGKIPSQLLQLHWLSDFSVAHNNLSGSTPGRVDQFATFENTSYEGNPFLCGLPLTKSCSLIVSPSPNAEEEEEDDEDGFMDMEAFYVSCVISYIIVLFTIAAVLYVNPYWRRRWFYMITNCYYYIEDNLLFPLFKFRAS